MFQLAGVTVEDKVAASAPTISADAMAAKKAHFAKLKALQMRAVHAMAKDLTTVQKSKSIQISAL